MQLISPWIIFPVLTWPQLFLGFPTNHWPISAQCCVSYINQSFGFDLQSKTDDWFLYETEHWTEVDYFFTQQHNTGFTVYLHWISSLLSTLKKIKNSIFSGFFVCLFVCLFLKRNRSELICLNSFRFLEMFSSLNLWHKLDQRHEMA